MKKFLWANDADIWYSHSDWIVAESAEECDEILAKHEKILLSKILKRKYNWSYKYRMLDSEPWRDRIATGPSRYVGFGKSSEQ